MSRIAPHNALRYMIIGLVGVVDQSTSSGVQATARGEQLCSNECDRCGQPAPVALKRTNDGMVTGEQLRSNRHDGCDRPAVALKWLRWWQGTTVGGLALRRLTQVNLMGTKRSRNKTNYVSRLLQNS